MFYVFLQYPNGLEYSLPNMLEDLGSIPGSEKDTLSVLLDLAASTHVWPFLLDVFLS